ncbi:sodium channel protein Nach-like [Culicoides brevitarsis]|uniref:sodium channel protein Nach-like n=1 Tax=Culicoides brevitarsis TaxID=469753 RepID=UPI00307CC30B
MTVLGFFGAYIAIKLWESFIYSPILVTNEDVQVREVPFPAVTICHPQSVIDYKVEGFLKDLSLPPNISREQVAEKLVVLSMFTEFQWEPPDYAALALIDEVLLLNNISVSTAIERLGSTCEDFLRRCVWNGKEFPCYGDNATSSSLKWHNSHSFVGSCCSFNYYPSGGTSLQTDFMGDEGGLKVVLTGGPQISDGKSGVMYSDGFLLVIHHPNDFPVESNYVTLIEERHESFIQVYGTLFDSTSEVLGLPFDQRNCILPQDIGRPFYRQPACVLACVRAKAYEMCGCHPYHYPSPKFNPSIKRIRDCTVKDAACFVENMKTIMELQCVECLPSCNDISYSVRSFKIELMSHNASFAPKYKLISDPEHEILVNVYWAKQNVNVNRRIIVVNWVQMLANLGGCFNLVFGISAISLIEIIYVLTVRFQYRIKNQFQRRFWKSERIKFLLNIQNVPQKSNKCSKKLNNENVTRNVKCCQFLY